jgi:hypothetical protein
MEIEDILNLKSELIDELNTRNSKLIVFIENEIEKARFGELEQIRLHDMEAAINLSGQILALQKTLNFIKKLHPSAVEKVH